MRLGYSTNAFVNFSLCEAVEKIAQLGFGGIEILADRPHLYPPDFDPPRIEALRRRIEGKGLRIINLNSFTLFAVGDTYLPSWIESREERRQIRVDHTIQALKTASLLGSPNISTAPGGPVEGISRKEAMALFCRGLERALPLAEELKIRLLVEPEPGLLIENGRQFREFIREVRSPALGLNFDIGHFFCVGEDPSAAFQDLFPWVGHVHLDDIARSRIHHHLIPGDGAINLRRVFQTIGTMGYRGDMSLELYTYSEIPLEAGRESLRFLLPLLQEAGLVLES